MNTQIARIAFFVSMASMVSAGSALAQVHLSTSLAVPVGSFATLDEGMAQMGFGVSAAYYKPLSPQVSVGAEIGLNMNTMDRAAFAGQLLAAGASDVSVGGGTYFNYPLLASILVSPAPVLAPGVSLYAGAGLDFLTMSDMTLNIDDNNGSIEFDPRSAFAWGLGGQVAFGRVFFGMRYMNLGEHAIVGEVGGDGVEETLYTSQKISLVNLMVGIRI